MAKAEKAFETQVVETEVQTGVTLTLTLEEAGAVRELLGAAIWWREGEGPIIEGVYQALVGAGDSGFPGFTLTKSRDDRPILTRDAH